jgi:hypothetical protein
VLTVTALQEIPSPPGTATVRIDVEIDAPEDEADEASNNEAHEADSDPVDDTLVGVATVGGGLIASVGKMIGAVADALIDDD